MFPSSRCTLRYNIFQLCLPLMSTSVFPSARRHHHIIGRRNIWSTNLDDRNNIFFYCRFGCLEAEQKPVWTSFNRNRKKKKKYPALKLELLSPQNRYLGHKAIFFFAKGSLSIKVLIKALEVVESWRKSTFFKYLLNLIGFWPTFSRFHDTK